MIPHAGVNDAAGGQAGSGSDRLAQQSVTLDRVSFSPSKYLRCSADVL
jgi:hypothetical protein